MDYLQVRILYPSHSPSTQDASQPLDYGSNISHFFLSAGAKAFVCDQCGAQFSKEDALETHRQTHTGECPWLHSPDYPVL